MKKSNLPKWKRCLDKKDLEHLKQHKLTSLESFKKMRKDQKELMKNDPTCLEHCWDCWKVESKLKEKGLM